MAPVKEFAIPVALDPDDVPTRPALAAKSNGYRCPRCLSKVVLRRRSARNRSHFAHGVGTCSLESVLHITAKLLIAHVVRTWRAGGPAPQFIRRCPRCRAGHHVQQLPEHVHGVATEHRLETGVVPDVVLLDADARPIAAIELLATHRVDEPKVPRMTVPWLELLASHVAENPLLWIPVQDHLKPIRQCAACNANDVELAARYDEHGYIAKPFACYKCKAAMIVYMWRGKSLWDDEPPPDPVPPTLQYRYSRTAEAKYWANVCPSCNAVQGDWFLRHPDRPFFGHVPDQDLEWRRICDEDGLPAPEGWTAREALRLLRALGANPETVEGGPTTEQRDPSTSQQQ